MTRIWIDGCFDLFHFGHANAIRQARAFGDMLVAGVHSDAEIEEHKGPPVLSLAERTELVRTCRWVDEVVPLAPYVTDIDFVKSHGIDIVVHGDDVTTDASGLDTYRLVKEAGMYREFKRTEGISTTDAISRVLADTSSEPYRPLSIQAFANLLLNFATVGKGSKPTVECLAPDADLKGDRRGVEDFKEGDSLIVALDGALNDNSVIVSGPFDGLSVDDLNILESWHFESPLIVAIWSSEEVLERTGKPAIFSTQERALSILQCKYVSAVIVPALTTLKASYELSAWPSPLYQRIEGKREALEARQARKLKKRVLEEALAGTQQ